MNYRIATIADCDELTRLRMAMRKELDNGFQEEALVSLTKDFFQRNIPNGSHVAFVCEDKGQLVADVGLTLFEVMPTTKSPNGKVEYVCSPSIPQEGNCQEVVGNCSGVRQRK